MIDCVEEAFDVALDYSGNTFSAFNLVKSGVTAPSEPEAMGGVKEGGFKNGFHNHEHSLLNDFVARGGNPQGTELAIWFRDVHPTVWSERV